MRRLSLLLCSLVLIACPQAGPLESNGSPKSTVEISNGIPLAVSLEAEMELVVLRTNVVGTHEHTFTMGATGGTVEARYDPGSELLYVRIVDDQGAEELFYYQSPIRWIVRARTS